MRKQFLVPFNLGKKDCFMAPSSEAEAKIKASNPQLANFCFQKPQPGKPKVFVIGAALLAAAEDPKTDAVSYQISPDYSGTPFYVDIEHRPLYVASKARGEWLDTSIVGGGFIQTFGVGAAAPINQTGGLRDLPSPRRPFTLADAMAFATYADFLPGKSFDWTPSAMYWPIGRGSAPARRFMIGDGGFIEDTGLLPMLQRRVPRIALFLFVGPGQQLNASVDYCKLSTQIASGGFDPSTFKAAGNICDSLYTMFGYGYDDGQWHKSHNTVFKQSDMFEVGCEIQKLKQDGKPLVIKKTHKVQANSYWGIRPYQVEIIYMYNDRVPEFEKRLPKDTQNALQHGMKGFPTDLPAGLYMKPRIIKLMAAQAEYSIMENKDLFVKLFKRD